MERNEGHPNRLNLQFEAAYYDYYELPRWLRSQDDRNMPSLKDDALRLLRAWEEGDQPPTEVLTRLLKLEELENSKHG